MSKILVLGGAGFIGFHLVEKLSARPDHHVTVCDSLFRGRLDPEMQHLLSTRSNMRLVTADLTENSSYRLLGTDYDHVYLLAGIVGVRYTQEMPDRVVYTNATIVLQALEWVKGRARSKLLFASTSEVYGGAGNTGYNVTVPTPEDVPLIVEDIRNPRYSYAASKLLGEAAIVAYRCSFGLNAVIVRYHNVYGPRMGYDHVIPELSLRLLRRENPFRVYGCDQSRAFCYVSDAVDATIAVMESDETDGEILHIGNGQETQIESLAHKLCALAGFYPDLERLPASPGSVKRRCPDLSKANQLLGYRPAVCLDDGLERTFEWYATEFNKPASGKTT